MKHFALVNLSPRKEGTSMTLLNACKDHLESCGHAVTLTHLYPGLKNPAELFNMVSEADTLVFCGPCYINTYPADTTWLLQQLAARPDLLRGQAIYGIIQGGMPTAHTHASGLSMLRIFASQCGLQYKGGFVMGMGAMLNGQPLNKLFNAKVVIRQFGVFLSHMEKGETSPPAVYEAAQLKWSPFKYRMMSKMINSMMVKDFGSRGIDITQPSAYL